MRVAASSDLHGFLPRVPPCDLLLLAGDLCPLNDHGLEFQGSWLNTDFRRWLEGVPAKRIVGVAGNHDFVFEQAPELVPADLPWIYLQDTAVTIDGRLIWGSPWQKWFADMAFNAPLPDNDEEKFLTRVYSGIPDDAAVVMTHGPPYGVGDRTPRDTHAGSRALLRRLQDVQPRLAVFGHIHAGRGLYRVGETPAANVAHVNENYLPAYPPMEFTI
jgi:predicted phosphohydrolase